MSDLTHFGFESIESERKKDAVATVFDSVSRKYDLMNDLLTLGMHRGWKRKAIAAADIRPGDRVLDVASGTGDIAIGIARKVGPTGEVILSDINSHMLAGARRKIASGKHPGKFGFVEADAEDLPFPDESFDAVTISFGLRNVTDQDKALRSILRVLKPGGRLVVLEFSRPVDVLVRPAYDAYSFAALPALGKIVLNDAPAYRYLAESIRMHPDRMTLRDMVDKAGYQAAKFRKLLFGIVAIHTGAKAA